MEVDFLDFEFLGKINSPSDLKQLNNNETEKLCEEIRAELIKTVSNNGGHLASNLGAVELTVALHRVFDSPNDPIIFDVGHQCYTHKMLTGRYEQFYSIRKENGLSGFMRPDESVHDPVVTGHASNSIAAAYGIYKAKRIKGEKGCSIAVIGDGALTGGLAFEALNNIGGTDGNFIVVVNDNEMSISENVGSLSAHFTEIRQKPGYYVFKAFTKKFIRKIPLINNALYSLASKLKSALKNIIYRDSLFESLGFNYFGPIDGHDIEELENIFRIAKRLDKPCIIHVLTVKGKGYLPAENKPSDYHGVKAFNIEEGVTQSQNGFSHICGEALTRLADDDQKICAITAAMCSGTGLEKFSIEHPDRFFDVGIAEEFAVTFSSGLATGGMKPYFAVYSTFLARGYGEIIHDTAISGLPVRFLIDRAGIVGEDGETHQGLFDVAFMTTIPGMTVYSPASYDELRGCLEMSVNTDKPLAIRYPRGSEKFPFPYYANDFTVFKNNGKIAIASYGIVSSNAIKAQKLLDEKGIAVDFIKLNKIFPISEELIKTLNEYSKVYFFEEGIRNGGIGEHILGRVSAPFSITAVENGFLSAMTVERAREKCRLDTESIVKIIESEKK